MKTITGNTSINAEELTGSVSFNDDTMTGSINFNDTLLEDEVTTEFPVSSGGAFEQDAFTTGFNI